MTKVTKRTFLGTLSFSDGIMATSTDWLIEGYNYNEARALLDKKAEEERQGIIDDNYTVDVQRIDEYTTYAELVGLMSKIYTSHEMKIHSLKVVDSCEAVNNSDQCTEGCDGIQGVDYGEPKIDATGSEMSARHIGKCIHGVVIMDRTEVYNVEKKGNKFCQCANRTRAFEDENDIEHCDHCHKRTGE